MKPPEVLGMLEEAAGTRMYETKKDSALKTLDKKQVKVDEIDRVRGFLTRSTHISSVPVPKLPPQVVNLLIAASGYEGGGILQCFARTSLL